MSFTNARGLKIGRLFSCIHLVIVLLSFNASAEDHSVGHRRHEETNASSRPEPVIRFGETSAIIKRAVDDKDPGSIVELIAVARIVKNHPNLPTSEELANAKSSGLNETNPTRPEIMKQLISAHDWRLRTNQAFSPNDNFVPKAVKEAAKLVKDGTKLSGNPGAIVATEAGALVVESTDYLGRQLVEFENSQSNKQIRKEFSGTGGKWPGLDLNPGLNLTNIKSLESGDTHLAVAKALEIFRANPEWIPYLERTGVIPPGFLSLTLDQMEARYPGSTAPERIAILTNAQRAESKAAAERHERFVSNQLAHGVALRSTLETAQRIEQLQLDAQKDSTLKRKLLLSSISDPKLLAEVKHLLSTDEIKQIEKKLQAATDEAKAQQQYELTMAGLGLLQTLAGNNKDLRTTIELSKAAVTIMRAAQLSNPVMAIKSVDDLMKFLLAVPDINEEILTEVKAIRRELADLRAHFDGRLDDLQREIHRVGLKTQAQLMALEARVHSGTLQLSQEIDQTYRAAEAAETATIRSEHNRLASDIEHLRTRNREGSRIFEVAAKAKEKTANAALSILTNEFARSASALHEVATHGSSSVLSHTSPIDFKYRLPINVDASDHNYPKRIDETRAQRYDSRFTILKDLGLEKSQSATNLELWHNSALPFAKTFGHQLDVPRPVAERATELYCAWDPTLAHLGEMIDVGVEEINKRHGFLPLIPGTTKRDITPFLGYLANYEHSFDDLNAALAKDRSFVTEQRNSKLLKGYSPYLSIGNADVVYERHGDFPSLNTLERNESIPRCEDYQPESGRTHSLQVDKSAVPLYLSLIPREALIASQILGAEIDLCYRDADVNSDTTAKRTDYTLTLEASITLPGISRKLKLSRKKLVSSDELKTESSGVWGVVAHFDMATRPFDRIISEKKSVELLPEAEALRNLHQIVIEVDKVQKNVRDEIRDSLVRGVNRKHSEIGEHLTAVNGAKLQLQAFLMDALGDKLQPNESSLYLLVKTLPGHDEIVTNLANGQELLTTQEVYKSIGALTEEIEKHNLSGGLSAGLDRHEQLSLNLIKQYLSLWKDRECSVEFDSLPKFLKDSLNRLRHKSKPNSVFEELIDKEISIFTQSNKKLSFPGSTVAKKNENQISDGSAEKLNQVKAAIDEAVIEDLRGSATYLPARLLYKLGISAQRTLIAHPEKAKPYLTSTMNLYRSVLDEVPNMSAEEFVEHLESKLGGNALDPKVQVALIDYLNAYVGYFGDQKHRVFGAPSIAPSAPFMDLEKNEFHSGDTANQLLMLQNRVQLIRAKEKQADAHSTLHQARAALLKSRQEQLSAKIDPFVKRYHQLVGTMNAAKSKVGYEQAITAERYIRQLSAFRSQLDLRQSQAADQLKRAQSAASKAELLDIPVVEKEMEWEFHWEHWTQAAGKHRSLAPWSKQSEQIKYQADEEGITQLMDSMNREFEILEAWSQYDFHQYNERRSQAASQAVSRGH